MGDSREPLRGEGHRHVVVGGDIAPHTSSSCQGQVAGGAIFNATYSLTRVLLLLPPPLSPPLLLLLLCFALQVFVRHVCC